MPLLHVTIHNVDKVIDTDELRTIEQTIDLLNITRTTYYRWIEEKRLTPIDIAGKIFIHQSEIDRIINERTAENVG